MPTPHRTPGRRRSTRSLSPRGTSGFSSASQLFPLSHAYDAERVLQNQMGLNALWPTEWLCQEMVLRPGMRVLDRGCGKALSSIFLAREYGVQAWATDLGIPATDNLRRIGEAGLSDRVLPIHADTRCLPYGEAFFDATVCVDA